MASVADIIKGAFGKAYHLTQGYSSKHDGWDIGAPEGTPIYAVVAGTVEYARDARLDYNCGAAWACGGGNTVNINIGGNRATQYAHMSRMAVVKGQSVAKGQLIGYVGRTGGKDSRGNTHIPGAEFVGAHVHFGLWDKAAKKMLNPKSLLDNAGNVAGGPHPGKDADDAIQLGAWADKIKFPVGHIITVADVDKMMDTLDKAGYFKDDPAFLGIGKSTTRQILMTAVGKQWDKSLQDQLQKQFGLAAQEATALGGVSDAIGGIGDAITKVAAYGAALVLIVVGLYLYSRSSGEAYGPA